MLSVLVGLDPCLCAWHSGLARCPLSNANAVILVADLKKRPEGRPRFWDADTGLRRVSACPIAQASSMETSRARRQRTLDRSHEPQALQAPFRRAGTVLRNLLDKVNILDPCVEPISKTLGNSELCEV